MLEVQFLCTASTLHVWSASSWHMYICHFMSFEFSCFIPFPLNFWFFTDIASSHCAVPWPCFYSVLCFWALGLPPVFFWIVVLSHVFRIFACFAYMLPFSWLFKCSVFCLPVFILRIFWEVGVWCLACIVVGCRKFGEPSFLGVP